MKKLIPLFLLLLFSPSCIFVVSESDHCDACEQRSGSHEHGDYDAHDAAEHNEEGHDEEGEHDGNHAA